MICNPGLGTFFFDRKKYAVETKQAKNSSFDAVGSQQILGAFDRKEAVKRVKRNLVPCRSALSVLLAWRVCGCACACFVKQDMNAKRATCSADSAGYYVLSAYSVTWEGLVQYAALCCLHCPWACTQTGDHTLPHRSVADHYHERSCSSLRQQKINNACKLLPCIFPCAPLWSMLRGYRGSWGWVGLEFTGPVN